MENVRVERLDHLGLIASVINDLGLVSLIDARLKLDDQEALTSGEAIKAMILGGLGFANRPLSLTPQFFANKPLDLLFRPGVEATMLNRFKLGRTLDKVNTYGSDLLFSEIALAVCQQEAIEPRFNHLDTTSFSLTGDYVPESDQQAIAITHGYSKDHRPDLKQAVLELMVSQDGGVPIVSKTWDGNASDSQIFQDRAQALLSTFKDSPTPRYLIADSKLYSKANAAHLKPLSFMTRIPETLKIVSQVISQALQEDTRQRVDDTTRYHGLELCHYGRAQRWLVVSSEAAMQRAENSVSKACQREFEAIEKQLFHLQAQCFESQEQAQAALATRSRSWRYHQVATTELIEHKRYAGKGRPSAKTPIKAIEWQIRAQVRPDVEAIWRQKQHKGCFVLGSNIEAKALSDEEVIVAYKAQSQVEGGFRFLKDPLFFVSSLFVKKPIRIQGLLMVMTLALLVYSVAQRRLRQELARQKESLPNQINQPTQRPTLRWIFQLLEGINRVRLIVQDQVHDLIEGLNEVQIKILRLFGQEVCQIYQISSG
ncbi:MAG: transposase [Candidatus Entotheonella factor]|uniref:Transposase n=1 Tax=Entotheonella factor TaxID=1429438 RepID=W4LSN7_ENTF1|nr:MAG: transposase [Candidatus Entotheonella factor]